MFIYNPPHKIKNPIMAIFRHITSWVKLIVYYACMLHNLNQCCNFTVTLLCQCIVVVLGSCPLCPFNTNSHNHCLFSLYVTLATTLVKATYLFLQLFLQWYTCYMHPPGDNILMVAVVYRFSVWNGVHWSIVVYVVRVNLHVGCLVLEILTHNSVYTLYNL